MANPRYNTQVTQPRGSSARVGDIDLITTGFLFFVL